MKAIVDLKSGNIAIPFCGRRRLSRKIAQANSPLISEKGAFHNLIKLNVENMVISQSLTPWR